MGNNMRFGQYAKYIRLMDRRYNGRSVVKTVAKLPNGAYIAQYVNWEHSYKRAKQILMPWAVE